MLLLCSVGSEFFRCILVSDPVRNLIQEMMKAATIGRSSEFGGDWEPPGMVSRKIAALLTTGGLKKPMTIFLLNRFGSFDLDMNSLFHAPAAGTFLHPAY